MVKTLEERFWVKVDKSDNCWIWIASLRNGYGAINPGRHSSTPLYAHRVSYEWANGPIPEGMQVDHACHNRACVNPDHLRLATNKQNTENHNGPNANNKSTGIRGVLKVTQKKRTAWWGRVKHNGVIHYCGIHSTPEEAEAAVVAKRLELFTHNDLDRISVNPESSALSRVSMSMAAKGHLAKGRNGVGG